jgi:hypothetical protein
VGDPPLLWRGLGFWHSSVSGDTGKPTMRQSQRGGAHCLNCWQGLLLGA